MDNSVALLSSVIYDDKVVKCGYTYYFGNPEILLSKPFTDMFLNRHWKAWVNIMLSVLLMIKLPLFKTLLIQLGLLSCFLLLRVIAWVATHQIYTELFIYILQHHWNAKFRKLVEMPVIHMLKCTIK